MNDHPVSIDDHHDREKAIAYFNQIASGQMPLSPPRPKAKSIRWLLQDYQDRYELSLPAAPTDNTYPFISQRQAAARAARYLREGRLYQPAERGWSVSGVFILLGMATGVTGLILSALGVRGGRMLIFIGFGAWIGMLMLIYIVGLCLTMKQIILVRLGRKNLNQHLDEDAWPYSAIPDHDE